jgi:RNA polymerase sigma factor (TIGR02999 family)
MGTPGQGEITRLLSAWGQGEQAALGEAIPLIYAELRRIAHRHMRAQPLEHSLQTTALVNEAYLRLAGACVKCKDRVHFLAICGQLMRRILVDFARSRGAVKRGGYLCRVEFDEGLQATGSADLIRLDDALKALARVDPRKAKVIELRFFGGLSVEESAQALAVSRETLLRDWRLARAWLKSELGRGCRNG